MENDLVIQGLLKLRAEMAGSVVHLEAQAAKLRADLHHVDSTLRIAGYASEEVALPVRKACTSGLFHRKELPRLMVSLLRASNGGMQASEIAIAISRDKGWEIGDKRFQLSLKDKVSRALSKMKVRGRVTSSEGDAGYVWTLTPLPAANTQPTPAKSDD